MKKLIIFSKNSRCYKVLKTIKMHKNIPELRFPEFEGEWEFKELGEVSEKTNIKNTESIYSETFTNSAKHGIISQRDFFDKDISNKKNLNNYYVVKDNYFVYNPRISIHAPVGPIKRNNLGRTGLMSPLYYVFKTLDINKDFLEYYFSTTKWHKFMIFNGNTGARSDRLSIKDFDFKKMHIPYPSIKEQQKIGNFLITFDKRIEKEEDKLVLLEKQKKEYMKLIFSQKIRIKNENGNDYPQWEKFKIEEVLNERNEKSDIGELLSVTISSGIRKFVDLNIKDNSSDNKKNYKKVYIGDLAYNSMRMWQGASGKSIYEGIVSPAYTVLFPRDNIKIDMDFIAYYFKTYKMIHTFKRNSQGLTSDTWNLKYRLLKEININICNIEEQEKISFFLKKLDERIELQSQKTVSLKKQKTGLLQKIFI